MSRLLVRDLGADVPYGKTYAAMREYTLERDTTSADELWVLEHQPVYTMGLRSHNEKPTDNGIPTVMSDRGGLVTYHGPGQLMGYVLLDLRRANIGIKTLVHHTESLILRTLSDFGIAAVRIKGAPGLYTENAKIAAIGYRVSRGCSYHGFCLNVALDLHPYESINACGLNMASTMMAKYVDDISFYQVKQNVIDHWQHWYADINSTNLA